MKKLGWSMPSGETSASRVTGLTPLPNPNPVGTGQEKGGCYQDGWWLFPKRHGCGSVAVCFKLPYFEKGVQKTNFLQQMMFRHSGWK